MAGEPNRLRVDDCEGLLKIFDGFYVFITLRLDDEEPNNPPELVLANKSETLELFLKILGLD